MVCPLSTKYCKKVSLTYSPMSIFFKFAQISRSIHNARRHKTFDPRYLNRGNIAVVFCTNVIYFLQPRNPTRNFPRMELATSTPSNPARSVMSTGQGCHLSRLPPEILLHIVRFLVSKDPRTLVGNDDYSSLIPLSSCHSGSRQICIAAGLFWKVYPKSTSFKKFKEFGDSLDLRTITSLAADLGN
jgi:hypothetical protein